MTLMVGFWLSHGKQVAAFADWVTFTASYLSVVALEPVFTLLIVNGVAAVRSQHWARACFDERLTCAA